jgi:hypothetical protein
MTRITTAAVLTLFSLAALQLDAARIQTETFLSPSSTNPAFGSALLLTATVVDTQGNAVISTGGVTFYDGVNILGSVAVNSDTADLVVRNLPPGVRVLTARYLGTSTYAPSVSHAQDITVAAGVGGAFVNSSNPATGTTPQSIAYGDFNRDGITDLVTANAGSNNVSVFLGAANGTFAAAVNYPAGSGASSVVVADFNLDGALDLVVTDQSTNTLSVLTGNGDGTFNAALTVTTVTNPSAVAVADVNGDGLPDVVVTSATSDEIAVQLNTGATGLFAAPVTTAIGGLPVALTVADFNGDGLTDVAVVNVVGGTTYFVSVLLGTGTGTFAVPTPYALSAGADAVAAGDFNKDGAADLAVANGSSNSVSILLNTGSGTFDAAVNYPREPAQARSSSATSTAMEISISP